MQHKITHTVCIIKRIKKFFLFSENDTEISRMKLQQIT